MNISLTDIPSAVGEAAAAVTRSQLPKAGCIKYALGPTGTGMEVTATVPQEAKGTVYLAGPILGQTYVDARFGWRQQVLVGMLPGIQVLSPMRHEGHLSEHVGLIDDEVINEASHFFAESKIIFAKDVLDIRCCDVVLVNFLGTTQPSLGTVSEIGMAYILNKTIITVIEKDNIHLHPFVLEPSALVLDNLDDAIYAVNSLLSTGI